LFCCFFAEAELSGRVFGNGFEVSLGSVATFHGRAQPPRRNLLALGASKPLRPRAGDQIPLDVARCIGEVMRLIGANLERARSYWLPDEKSGYFAAAERRRQYLGVQTFHGDFIGVDAVLAQVFRNEPRAGRSDACCNCLSDQVLRLLDV